MKISNFKFQISNLIAHPLFSGSAIMIVGSNGVSFLNYLYTVLMARMLGPVGYGELASIISSIGLLGFLPAAIGLVIVKHVSSTKKHEESDNLIGWLKSKIYLASWVFFLVILAMTPFITSFLKISQAYYFILLAISSFFSLQAALNRSILQGLLKFKETVFSILFENSTKLIVSVLLVYLGFQVGGAMFALIISTLLGLYITNFYLKYRPLRKHYLTPPNVKSLLIFTIPVTAQYIATTSLISSDVILVKHFFPSHDAGIYAALSTLGKIIFFGTGPIASVMFPLVSRRSAHGQAHSKIFMYSFLASTLLAGSILLIYWLYPALAIKLLFGTAYLQAANLLVWFGIFMSLFTLSSVLISYGLSLGRTYIVILPFIAAVIQIIAILLFHQTLYIVILISIIIAALLLFSLLIYFILCKMHRTATA